MVEDNMDDLRDFEALVHMVEDLQAQLSAKEEQQAFLAEVIAEKQRLCEQAKAQHEEKIRSMARQARRHRIRKNGRSTCVPGAGMVASYETSLPPPDERDDEEEEEEEEEEGRRPSERGDAAVDLDMQALDMQLLEQALGEKASLLFSSGGGAAGGPDDAGLQDLHTVLRKALEDRLQQLQCLGCRVAGAAVLIREQNAGGGVGGAQSVLGQTEFQALKQEVVSAIGPHAPLEA